MKYTGCWILADSWTRAALIVWSVAMIYTRRGRCIFGLWRIGGDVGVVLRFWKNVSQSSFQENFVDFLRSWIMGQVCTTNFGRNLDIAVRRPIMRWTYLTLVGLHISMIALHFSGLASMLRCVSMKPRNLPLSMPKMNFSGLSLRLCYRSVENTADKSCACCRWLGDLTTMSSTYTLTHLPINLLNTLEIISVIRDECGFVHVGCGHWYLVVSRVCI